MSWNRLWLSYQSGWKMLSRVLWTRWDYIVYVYIWYIYSLIIIDLVKSRDLNCTHHSLAYQFLFCLYRSPYWPCAMCLWRIKFSTWWSVPSTLNGSNIWRRNEQWVCSYCEGSFCKPFLHSLWMHCEFNYVQHNANLNYKQIAQLLTMQSFLQIVKYYYSYI